MIIMEETPHTRSETHVVDTLLHPIPIMHAVSPSDGGPHGGGGASSLLGSEGVWAVMCPLLKCFLVKVNARACNGQVAK